MAQLAPFFKQKFTDANGDPLVGGKIYSYEAGTSTPLNTFTDQSEATANDNPIILDSSGEADIWLNSSSYKLVLKDANDNVLKTVDHVSDIADLSILTAKIADGAVTTAKLADGAVTRSKKAAVTYSTNFSSFVSTSTGNDTTLISTSLQSNDRPLLLILEGDAVYTNGGSTVGRISITDLASTHMSFQIGTSTASEVLKMPLYLTAFVSSPFPDISVTYNVVANSGDGSLSIFKARITVLEL